MLLKILNNVFGFIFFTTKYIDVGNILFNDYFLISVIHILDKLICLIMTSFGCTFFYFALISLLVRYLTIFGFLDIGLFVSQISKTA